MYLDGPGRRRFLTAWEPARGVLALEPEALRSRFQAPFTNGTLARELHDASGSDDHAVRILEMMASVRGRSHTWYAIMSMHVQEGKFSEVWV